MDTSIRVPRTRSRTGCFTCRKRKKKCDELLYPVCQNCQEKNLVCKWPLKKHEMHKKLEEVKYIGYEDKVSKSEAGSPAGSATDNSHQRIKPSKEHPNKIKSDQDTDVPANLASLMNHISDSANDLLSMEDLDGITFKDDILDPQGSFGNSLHGILGQDALPSANLSESTVIPIENYKPQGHIRRPTDPNIDYPYRVSKKDMINLEKKKHNYFLERIAMQQDCVDSDEEELDISPKGPFEIHLLLENDYVLNDENADIHEHVTRKESPLPKSVTQQHAASKLDFLPYRLKPSASGLFNVDSPLPH